MAVDRTAARVARALAFWLGLCGLAIVASPAAAARSDSPDPTVRPPSAAWMQVSPAQQPGDLGPDWKPVTLPDSWSMRGFVPTQPGAAWYRMTLELPDQAPPPGGWAVYLPYLYDGGMLFLNGERLASIAETDADTHVKWERPHLLRLPDAMVRPGANELLLRTTYAQAVMAALAIPKPRVGPLTQLQPRYELRLFWTHTIPLLISLSCILAAALMLFIWWRRRSEALYGLFGAMMLMWGIRTLTFVVEMLPQPLWPWWRGLYLAATGGFLVTLLLVVLQFGGFHWRPVRRALVGYALAGPLLMLATGGGADGWLNQWWLGGFTFLALATIAMVTAAAWRLRSRAALALAVSVWITVLGALHDYMILVSARWMAALWPHWVGERVYVFHVAASAVLTVMGAILAGRFIQTLHALETLNQTLEQGVAEREALLRDNYAQLTALERERAAVDERQRIMQDMHDGLGSRLFTSLSRTEREALSQDEMSQTLKACIAEMRMAIAALAPGEGDLQAAFGDFRFRWEAQLQAAGLTSSWVLDLPAEPEAAPISPHVTLQTLRILQEALTNVLKHAQADHVAVSLSLQDGRLRAEVRDNGRGLSPAPAAAATGQGLGNMRRRAARLGAALSVESGPQGGTRVTLDWLAAPATRPQNA